MVPDLQQIFVNHIGIGNLIMKRLLLLRKPGHEKSDIERHDRDALAPIPGACPAEGYLLKAFVYDGNPQGQLPLAKSDACESDQQYNFFLRN